jgi:hypothetical protein
MIRRRRRRRRRRRLSSVIHHTRLSSRSACIFIMRSIKQCESRLRCVSACARHIPRQRQRKHSHSLLHALERQVNVRSSGPETLNAGRGPWARNAGLAGCVQALEPAPSACFAVSAWEIAVSCNERTLASSLSHSTPAAGGRQALLCSRRTRCGL